MSTESLAEQTIRFDLLQDFVRTILENPMGRDWTLQGFGMLRTYLGDERRVRLHVWDSRFAFEDVSTMHTHPWNFHSTVIAGEVRNLLYSDRRIGKGFAVQGDPYYRQLILCGEGGHEVDEPVPVAIRLESDEVYVAGESYTQHAREIHVSQPSDGAVTLITREFLDDDDHAFVYWPMGQTWVTAEPRPATPEEIFGMTQRALANLR